MGQDTKPYCPKCGIEHLVEVGDDEHSDSVVKATGEEVVLELSCNGVGCNRVWRAVYAFVGNQ